MTREGPIAVCPEFEVVYEDAAVLVVNKAAPLIMHPVGGKEEPSLLQGVSALLAYELACGGQVSLVNRLDRETSGLVLIAKSAAAAHELGCAMMNHAIRKTYQAIVHGHPAWQRACCAEPILRLADVAPTAVRVRQACHPEGRPCCTEVRVLRRIPARGALPSLSLVECRPITGRMHQIRVHLAHLGHPIVGDKIYGGDETRYLRFIAQGYTPELARELILPRHALHACSLSFPFAGRTIRVTSPLPAELAALLPKEDDAASPTACAREESR